MSKKQDKIKDIILRSTENSVASVADDNVKANMEVETGAGMEPKILRSSDGKCCAWCSSLVGEYYEDEAPDDIYARHDNCNCTVTYISEKGYQDAHSKKLIDQQELEVRRERIATDRKNISKLRKEREVAKTKRVEATGKKLKKETHRRQLLSNRITNLDDEIAGRSAGAKFKNYDIMDLQTGEIYHFAEGSKLQNKRVFAGKGCKKKYRKAHQYAHKYGGDVNNWQHVKAIATITTPDGDRIVEVHWSQCEGIGKVEMFIKRWLD